MAGERTTRQGPPVHGFSPEGHVPSDHLLRSIGRFVELSGIRRQLAPRRSATGRPSIDPEPMTPLIGRCCGVRSARRLCQEVSPNRACRWFCRLDLTDAHRRRGVATPAGLDRECPTRAMGGRVAVLDDAAFGAAFGAASEVVPKFVSPAGPAARWTAAANRPACHACCGNSLIAPQCAVAVDIEPSTAIRQAEAAAARRMTARTAETFGVAPKRLAAGTGDGSAETLARLVHEHGIEPHVPVLDEPGCLTSQNARTAHSRATPSGSTTKATPMPAQPVPAQPANNRDDAVARPPCRGPGRRATAPCVAGPTPTSFRGVGAKRSGCCSRTSGAPSGWNACGHEARAVLATRPTAPPPPRTSGSSQC